MTELATATRFLYLTRHGEPSEDETLLTERGRRQAVLLGQRLQESPVSTIYHGPLPRTAQSAALIAQQLPSVSPRPADAAGDYVPYVPTRGELPPAAADRLLQFLGQLPAHEREDGATLAARAVDLWAGPAPGDEPRHELVVTHNFLIGWLVAHALGAPPWRWLGLNHCHAALTLIRYPPGGPASVAFYNEMSHLPPALRWTGFPSELHP